MIISKKQPVLIIFVLGLLLFGFSSVTADNIDLNNSYPVFQGVNINTVGGNQDLNQIIAWFYYLVVTISGFSAFFMLVWGGFDWLTSGVSGKKNEAKERINSALLGLLLILSSYLNLRVINPDLTTLNLPGL
jgi:hypothetical protein